MILDLALSVSSEDINEGGSLLQGLRNKNEDHLEVLISTYSSSLFRVAKSYLGNAEAADDVVQETFIAAWDGAWRTSEQTKIRSWLFGILFNRMKKHLRTLVRRRKREQKVAENRLDWEMDEAHLEQQEDQRALEGALSELDDKSRSVVLLRYMERLSVAETASVLKIPEGTVKSRTNHALKKLKQKLEVHG